MSLNNWVRAAGIEAGKNIGRRSSTRRRAGARARNRRDHRLAAAPIELLEGRLLLSSVPIGTQLSPGLASAVLTDSPVLTEVSAVHDKVFAALQNLPLVASALDSVSNGLSDNIKSLGNEITTALNTLTTTMTGTSIQTALSAGLASAGLNAGTLTVQLDDSTGGNTPDSVNMGLEFQGNLFTASVPAAFNLGLPGFGLKVNGNLNAMVTYDIKLNVSVNVTDGYYIDLSNGPQATLALNVTAPNTSLTGTLGFLQLTATDGTAMGNTQLVGTISATMSVGGDEKLKPGNVSSLKANSSLDANAEADVHLHNVLSFGGNADFPTLEADLDLTWKLADAKLDGGGVTSSIFGSAPDIQFNNIQLGLGTFFTNFVSPIIAKVQTAIKPVQPLIDLLQKRLPVFSDIGFLTNEFDQNHDGDVTLLEVLSVLSGGKTDFLNTIVAADNFINSIPTGLSDSLMLPLGSFEVGGAGPASSDLRGPNAELSMASPSSTTPMDPMTELAAMNDPQINSFITAMDQPALNGFAGTEGGGLKFPLLTNPTMAFDLLMGKNVDFFTFDTPTLNLGASLNLTFPILEVLQVGFRGTISATAHLSMGYDTQGIREFAGDNFNLSKVTDLLDGFYVLDDPTMTYATASLTINATAELNLVIAAAGVTGGLTGTVNFTVSDPNSASDGGKLRASAIANDLTSGNPLSLFNILGTLTASFDAFVQVGADVPLVGFVGYMHTFDLGDFTLATFDIQGAAPAPAPVLAHYVTGTSGELVLNMGPYASLRTNGDITDDNEAFTVTHVSTQLDGSETVDVNAFGFDQTYSGVTGIYAEGGAGNNQISISTVSPAMVYGGFNPNIDAGLTGTGDNNLSIGMGPATVTAGPGNDNLYVDPSDLQPVSLVAGVGNDTLTGGGGPDTLIGGGGTDILQAGSGADLLMGGSGDAVLTSGNGTADLVGGSGSDTLVGGTGVDTLVGGTGPNIFEYDSLNILMPSATTSKTLLGAIVVINGGVVSVTPVTTNIAVIQVTNEVTTYAPGFAQPPTAVMTDKFTHAVLSETPVLSYEGPGDGTPIDAGTYEVFASFPGDSNYGAIARFDTGATVTINKSTPSVQFSQTDQPPVPVDGQPHFPVGGQALDPNNFSVNLTDQLQYTYQNTADMTVSANAPTLPGTYEVSAGFPASANYNAVAPFDTNTQIIITSFFGSTSSVSTGMANINTVASGDITGSGTTDLICAGMNGSQSVAALCMGNGNGTYAQPNGTIDTPTDFALNSLMLANVGGVNGINNNPLPDLLVTQPAEGAVTLMLNTGNGNFAGEKSFATGAGPTSVAVADVNHDGFADLVVTNSLDGTVSVLLGNGDGTFANQQTFATGIGATKVTIADLNGDTNPDLVIQGHDDVEVLLGDGHGAFGAAQVVSTGQVLSLAIADLRNDGKVDLIEGTPTGASVFLGNGDGTFAAPIPLATLSTATYGIVVGDFNSDGVSDLAVSNFAAGATAGKDNSATILLGNGDGTFRAVDSTSSMMPYALSAANVTANGVPDLAIGDGSNIVSIKLASASKAPAVISVTSATAAYDGNAHAATANATGVSGVNLNSLLHISYENQSTHLVSTTAPTEAGTYSVLASFDGSAVYNSSPVADTGQTITITKVNATLTFSGATAPAGTTPQVAGATATGVLGEDLSSLLHLAYKNTANGMTSNTGPTTAGTYEVFAAFDGNTDYNAVGNFDTGKSVVMTPLSLLQSIASGKLPKGTLVSGQKITPFHFTISLSNGSANLATGPVTVNIVLSASPTDATGVSLGGITKSVKIKGSKKGAFGTVTIKSLPAGLHGTYFVVALLTDASMATNVISLGTINTALPFTDLSAVSLAIPPKARLGKTLSATFSILQAGNIPFGGNVPVELYLSTTPTLGTDAIDLGLVTRKASIKPGKKGILHLAATIPSATPMAKYFVIAKIDPANTLGDTNLGNNIVSSVKMVSVS